jgi:hypothetical protein
VGPSYLQAFSQFSFVILQTFAAVLENCCLPLAEKSLMGMGFVPAQFIYLADSLYKEMLICQLLQLGMF